MKTARLTIICLVLVMLLFSALTSSSQAASKDDVMERIKLLEAQIRQLKALKEQQKLFEDKEQHCFKATGTAKFCKCIAEALPQEVNFEQYVHYLVRTRDELKYDVMTPESRLSLDGSTAAREKCVEKGWFK